MTVGRKRPLAATPVIGSIDEAASIQPSASASTVTPASPQPARAAKRGKADPSEKEGKVRCVCVADLPSCAKGEARSLLQTGSLASC